MIFVLKIPLKTKRLEYVVLHAQSGKFSNQIFSMGTVVVPVTNMRCVHMFILERCGAYQSDFKA